MNDFEAQIAREKLNEVLNSIGAVAEMQAFHFEELQRRGFSRAEALELVKAFRGYRGKE